MGKRCKKREGQGRRGSSEEDARGGHRRALFSCSRCPPHRAEKMRRLRVPVHGRVTGNPTRDAQIPASKCAHAASRHNPPSTRLQTARRAHRAAALAAAESSAWPCSRLRTSPMRPGRSTSRSLPSARLGALAGAGVADRDDVLAALDVLRARQLHHERLVQIRERREVEAVEALHGWELGRLDAAVDHASLTLDDLGLDEPQQIARIVDALGCALAGDLVVLAQDRRQLQRFEVVSEKNLRGVGHDAAPTRRSI